MLHSFSLRVSTTSSHQKLRIDTCYARKRRTNFSLVEMHYFFPEALQLGIFFAFGGKAGSKKTESATMVVNKPMA